MFKAPGQAVGDAAAARLVYAVPVSEGFRPNALPRSETARRAGRDLG